MMQELVHPGNTYFSRALLDASEEQMPHMICITDCNTDFCTQFH